MPRALHVVSRLDAADVDGFVLFNRFFQPDIDVDREQNTYPFNFSRAGEYGLALRFAGPLYGHLEGDVCCNTGIFTGQDVVKMILAGATCVQVVSTLYKNKIAVLGTILRTVNDWMEGRGYEALADFRGALSRRESSDPLTAVTAVDRMIDTADGSSFRARVYTPESDEGRVVTYLHGGGWVVGDIDSHDGVCRTLAASLGARLSSNKNRPRLYPNQKSLK